MLKEVGDDPSDEKVKEFVLNTLQGGVSITTKAFQFARCASGVVLKNCKLLSSKLCLLVKKLRTDHTAVKAFSG